MSFNIKKSFLFRLFCHSKIAFGLSIAYILAYAVFFEKKMDMVFFPYNSMFSSKETEFANPVMYAVKINNTPIGITHHLYWKKDFLEQAPVKYAEYVSQNKISYLENFITRKNIPFGFRNLLLKNCTPHKTSDNEWFRWYANFSGVQHKQNADYKLMKYNLAFINGNMSVKDSFLIITSIP